MPVDLAALEFKERVKQATDIVDLVGGYLRLQPAGRVFKGHCPWHDDQRPSFNVDPVRQTVRCWVCNIGGDVFSFVMQTEKLSFREALEFLADRAGIPIPKSRGESAGSEMDRAALYKVLAWAEQSFHRHLMESAAAKPARDYLLGRGFSEQSLKDFRLGYASPESAWLIHRAKQAQISKDLLLKAGLIAARDEGGSYYDCFRDRAMFPIRDPQGRTIAFGGRILPGSDHPAKYVNTSGTALFDKKRVLFGLDAAAPAIGKAGHVLVMEGYTDCLIARQHGLHHCVAVLGTALGEAHIRLLQRYTNSVVLVLDGDKAGKTRAEQVLELFLASRMDLRVLTLPDNLDPCDFILKRGVESLQHMVASAPDALEYKAAVVSAGLTLGDGSQASNSALEALLNVFASAESPQSADGAAFQLRLDQLLTRIARRFRVSDEMVRARLHSLRQNKRAGLRTVNAGESHEDGELSESLLTKIDPWLRELLELLLMEPLFAEQLPRELLDRDLGVSRPIFEAIFDLIDEGLTTNFHHVMLAMQSPDLQTLLIDLDASARDKQQHSNTTSLVDRWRELLAAFQRQDDKRRHASELARLKENTQSEDEQLAQLLRMRQEIQNRQGVAKPMEG